MRGVGDKRDWVSAHLVFECVGPRSTEVEEASRDRVRVSWLIHCQIICLAQVGCDGIVQRATHDGSWTEYARVDELDNEIVASVGKSHTVPSGVDFEGHVLSCLVVRVDAWVANIQSNCERCRVETQI